LENCAEPLEITCERTIESLIAYGGGAQPQDDITLLAIECQGIEKSAPGEGNDKLLLFEKEEKMLIEMKQEGEVMVIKSLEKRMDARIATDFKEKMAAFIKEGQNLFVLDISGVEFIDSSALGAIISSLKLIGQKGNLVIAGATESVLSMFKLTRMDKVFRLFKNEKEAVSALST
ncbi:MAG: STAS domain-containing protein, partial [Thermodesulfobacteriota bacterium]|nr:STAS domain-containing protein [Thermodesulfobacteriota bacterium]